MLLPLSVMEKLHIAENDMVTLRSFMPAKGTFLRLQPLSLGWARLPDAREILEDQLRYFQVLAQGDIVNIQYLGKSYQIGVQEVFERFFSPFSLIRIADAAAACDFDCRC